MLGRIYLIMITIFFILLSFTLFFPAGHSTMSRTADNITLTEKDDGSRVQIMAGSILTVRLEAIPGTGYAWQVVRDDPKLLESLGEPIFEPKLEDKGKNIVGAPECQVLRFRAHNTGISILELHYIRKWEKKAVPLKRFSVTVQIN